jgi:hypothetical protein
MPKRILILYANSGFLRHKIIAENYATLLEKNGYDVEIADAFEVNSKAEIKAGKRLYFWLGSDEVKHILTSAKLLTCKG